MKRWFARLCLPCTLVVVGALALALTALRAAADPMRPLQPPAPATPPGAKGTPGQAGKGAGAARKGTDEGEAPEAPRIALVALRQNADGRWRALVGDQWVDVGDRLGERVVVAIDSNRLELTEGPRRITVHLLPWLQPSAPASAPAQEPARAPEVRQARAPAHDREGQRKP